MNLSGTEPLQVMLPSRGSDKIMFEGKFQELSVLRRTIKAQLESVKIGEISPSKVRIDEDDSFNTGTLILGNSQAAPTKTFTSAPMFL